MDAQMYWLQLWYACFLLLLLSSAALSRETEEGGHVKRQASKGVHLTALFADHGMHTSTRNHSAVNQCGGLSMERFKVNKHHSSPAETACGYVHLGSTPAVLLYGHSCLLLHSNCWGSLLQWIDTHVLAFAVQLKLLYVQWWQAVPSWLENVYRACCLESTWSQKGSYFIDRYAV